MKTMIFDSENENARRVRRALNIKLCRKSGGSLRFLNRDFEKFLGGQSHREVHRLLDSEATKLFRNFHGGKNVLRIIKELTRLNQWINFAHHTLR